MAKFKNRKRPFGFSLIELAIAVGISTVVAYMLFLSIRYGANYIRTSSVKMQLEQSARRGLTAMTVELVQTALAQVTISEGTGVNGTDVMTFRLPVASDPTTGAIVWGPAIQYLVGGLDNRQLLRTDAGITTNVLANDVTDLDFEPVGGSSTMVIITVSVQRTLANGRNIPNTPLPVGTSAEMKNG